ncbi:hypothetical protein (nucleomorph) [Guillardia theta]|uniref:Uncharacterized protein n=1 Tax=Guillardia theta TaxID=55529 RepID=Q98S42_GUITH|nr:hypothetical protein GTHECHR3097 [Guillardia theta]AAK39741.1 hypothetical protein [Guillardia theta]
MSEYIKILDFFKSCLYNSYKNRKSDIIKNFLKTTFLVLRLTITKINFSTNLIIIIHIQRYSFFLKALILIFFIFRVENFTRTFCLIKNDFQTIIIINNSFYFFKTFKSNRIKQKKSILKYNLKKNHILSNKNSYKYRFFHKNYLEKKKTISFY